MADQFEKQRLTRLTDEQARILMRDRADLSVPRVFIGNDGSKWALVHEIMAHRRQSQSISATESQ